MPSSASPSILFFVVLLAICATPIQADDNESVRPAIVALPVIQTPADFMDRSRPGPIVPGLRNNAIPQGLAYLPAQETYLVSAYIAHKRKTELASCIIVLPTAEDAAHKTIWLLNPDGSSHKGHVGGIATDGTQLWVASGKTVYSLDVAAVMAADDREELKMTVRLTREAHADVIAYDAGVLWVGDCTKAAERAICTRYEQQADGTLKETGQLTLPLMTQGMCFTRGFLICSTSSGGDDSILYVYRDPRPDLQEGGKLDLDDYAVGQITAPPMIEGIVPVPDGIAAVWENAAGLYIKENRKPLVDHIRVLPLR